MGIYDQAKEVFSEVLSKVNPSQGNLLVVGCSTSTIQGDMPGTNSSEDIAEDLYRALTEVFGKDFDIAVQCCEHLNRALIVEKSLKSTTFPSLTLFLTDMRAERLQQSITALFPSL